MRRSSGFLIRFIDLGLLLLMAFLAVAELDPTQHVALPGKPRDDKSAAMVPHVRVRFDEHMRMQVVRVADRRVLCWPQGAKALKACLDRHKTGRFLITPTGRATVQQFVRVLDLCEAEQFSCVASPE